MHNIIGIKIITNKPGNIIKTTSPCEYCSFIEMARTDLKFYTDSADITCPLARFNLGIEDLDEAKKDALVRYLIGWGDAKTEEIGIRYLDSLTPLPVEEKYIIYFPYPDEELDPDLIIEFSTPGKILAKVRRHTYLTGEPILCSVSGVGSLCGEATAKPILKKKPTISLGCIGSRSGVKLPPDELILAVPAEEKEYFFDE
jgi:uncharacterized protein (DUF169 family)